MSYFITIITGLILGSIPSAWLLLKKFNGKDIRQEGSGNVGAMNALEVSSSKLVGILVFLFDFIKGFLPVFIIMKLYPQNFLLQAMALVFAVAAHCFNPWLKFRGGRGLATAAGGSVLISPLLLFLWLILWLISFIYKREMRFSNFTATLLSGALIIYTADILYKYSVPPADSPGTYWITLNIMLLIILLRVTGPFIDFFKESRNIRRTENETD